MSDEIDYDEIDYDVCRSRYSKTCIVCYDTFSNVNKNTAETCGRQCDLILKKRMQNQKLIADKMVAITCTCKNVVGTPQRLVGDESVKLEFKCGNCDKNTYVWFQ